MGSTIAGINNTSLALRKNKANEISTPNMINPIKAPFNCDLVLFNSARLNSERFFIIQNLFRKSGYKNIFKGYTLV
jgi:hypothetical protein